MPLSIYFNGKFYSRPLNGVHRVADRLIRECDAILAASDPAIRPKARLLVPKQRTWHPELAAIELVEQRDGGRQRWEQWTLPRQAADGVLVNLANLAPIAHRRKILLIHDAQFLFPDSSYPAKQRIGYRVLVPWMARTSTRVLTVSNYSRAMLDLLGVVPRHRTDVLHNGADHILDKDPDYAILDRLRIEPGRFVLLFGSHKEYKNNRVVLEAFADSALSPLRLVIVGAGRDELDAAHLPIPADAVFTGHIDDRALRALYETAHCLTFPSRTEGFGLPPVEAMLCNCPVIVAPGGAIPEVCRDAVLYADFDDPGSWRGAIRSLAPGAERQAKIVAGAERGRSFTWAASGRRLLDMIEGVEVDPLVSPT